MSGGNLEKDYDPAGNGSAGPRERILSLGEESLSDEELIGLLLVAGPRRIDPGRPARRLLAEAGGLRRLARLKAGELLSHQGIGPAGAARILAVFGLVKRLSLLHLEPGRKVDSSRDVYAHFHLRLRDKKKETFFVLLLDSKNRLLREEQISEGSLNASIVHPREVFQTAIRESAASILAVHNHPSGDPSPSREDYEITQRLKEVGDLLGITLLDHVILGERRYISFREHRLIAW